MCGASCTLQFLAVGREVQLFMKASRLQALMQLHRCATAQRDVVQVLRHDLPPPELAQRTTILPEIDRPERVSGTTVKSHCERAAAAIESIWPRYGAQ